VYTVEGAHGVSQEDVTEYPEPRMFWPREIWGQYASKLEEFKEPGKRTEAVQCLNHMVGVDGPFITHAIHPGHPPI